MNEGVKVLIERMKTNPEDFQMHPIPQGMKRGRFYWITEEMQNYLLKQGNHYYMTLLKQEDMDALVNAFKDMHQQDFTDRVMKDLFKEEEQTPSPDVAGGWLPQGQRAQQSGRYAIGNTVISPYLAQIDSTSGITSATQQHLLSNGGTGTTASPWFKGLFK